MKTTFFYFFLIFVLLGCAKKTNEDIVNSVEISDRLNFTFEEKGVNIHSGDMDFFLPKSKLPLQKIVLLNASLVGYFIELNLQEKIVGITSPQYIYDEIIRRRVKDKKITIVGNDQKINIEKLIFLAPDAVFTNYIPTHENTYKILRKNGIELIFLDEYLEQNPLERAAYLKFFGVLMGKENRAENTYKHIEKNYLHLKNTVAHTPNAPMVMANEMYGNIWYMPAGKSYLATLIQDAGGRYILAHEPSYGAVSLSFEKAFSLSQNAIIWVNVGNYTSKKQLLSHQPQYQYLNVFQNGKIYSLQKAQKGNANNFFEEGNVRVDRVLKDYIIALHPSLFPKDSLRYLHELK